MKFITLIFSFTLIWITVQAQESEPSWLKILGYGIGNQSAKITLSQNEVQDRKAQCIPESFSIAQVTLNNGDIIPKVKIKYDFKDHILIIEERDTFYVAASNLIEQIDFLNHPNYNQLINVRFLGRSFDRRGFYDVLYQKENGYFLKYQSIDSKIRDENRNLTGLETLGNTISDTTIINRLEYYIYDDRRIFELSNFKSKTLESLNKPDSNLKNYIKEEKLKFKEEEDLIQFARYYFEI